jgi:isopenicillin N synthase-like dioxygenase
MVSKLPVIDVAPWRGGDFSNVKALREACETVGFFVIDGHGVDAALQAELERATRAFFALPLATKLELAMARGGRAWRGYFPVGGELTSGVPDVKEGLYLGAELGPDDRRVQAGWPMHGPNLFPDAALPQLRAVVLAWMESLEQLGHLVMRGLAASLSLEPDFFERALTREPLGLFRLFHYPVPAASSGWGVGEHTDYGLLTLLKQDDCGGLEVKTPGGWLAVPPTPGAFVCNLGDMLDRLTGGRYRSTPHRVRNTAGRSRYSWPFFFDPGFDAEVRPLPGTTVRPAALDAGERWDRASVHTLTGTYGDYLVGKVGRVFPALGAQVLTSTS